MKNYFETILDLFIKNQTLSKETQNYFYNWLIDDKEASEKEEALRKIWKSINKKKYDNETRLAYLKVEEKIGIQTKPTRKKYALRLWQIAAAILAIFSLSTLYLAYITTPSNLIEHFVPIAQINNLTLPDGTQVLLNSKSTLLYPEKFDGKTRSVYLIGEANFKVTHDSKPFIVKSKELQVTALGTEFNVSAYPENPIVTAILITGSVRVDYNNSNSNIVLHPSEQLNYNKENQTCEIRVPNMHDITAWQRGELVFNEMKLEEIITLLERKYPYIFQYKLHDFNNDKFNFRFSENATFNEVVEIITKVVGNMTYKIEKDKCFLYSKKKE